MADIVKKDVGIATAYGYAKSKGYTGTEEEFAQLLANVGKDLEETKRISANVGNVVSVDIPAAKREALEAVEQRETEAVQAVAGAEEDAVQAVKDQQGASEQELQKKADEQLARIPEVEGLAEDVASLKGDVNELQKSVFPLNSFFPLSLGRMNSSGIPTASQKHGYTSDFFYAKKGSYLKINQTEDIMRMRIAIFTEPNRDSFVSIITSLTEYEFTADSWYRVDIEYRDTTVIATEDIFDNIIGYIIKDNETQFVDGFKAFKSACENTNVKKIVLTKDIVATEQTNVIGDKHINGFGHKITGNADITYLIKVHDSKNVTIENAILEGAKDDVIYVGNGTTYIIDCDISKSYENDGVGLHAAAICYIRDCKIHDNYDEGLSTHDQSWCECANVEAYHNGYIVGTDTPSTNETGGQVSFGGLHFGGSKMGNAKKCYCHNNSANGIGFITIDGNFITDCIAVCEGNICTDNVESGIRFGGTYGIRAIGNMCANNGQGMLFYKKDNHGNTGIVGQNSLFNNTGSQRGVWSGGDDGLIFEAD